MCEKDSPIVWTLHCHDHGYIGPPPCPSCKKKPMNEPYIQIIKTIEHRLSTKAVTRDLNTFVGTSSSGFLWMENNRLVFSKQKRTTANIKTIPLLSASSDLRLRTVDLIKKYLDKVKRLEGQTHDEMNATAEEIKKHYESLYQ